MVQSTTSYISDATVFWVITVVFLNKGNAKVVKCIYYITWNPQQGRLVAQKASELSFYISILEVYEVGNI